MNLILVRREIKSNLFSALMFFGVIALYVVCIVIMYDPSLEASLSTMQEAMPELFAAFGMASPTTTLVDFMVNYLQKFLLVLFPLAFMLMAVHKMLVKPLESGSLAFTLALPLTRRCIVLSFIGAFAALLIGLLVATTLCEIACAALLFPGDLDASALLRANAGLLGLWLFMGGLVFLGVCVLPRPDRGFFAGAGVCLLFYLMGMLADLQKDWDILKVANPYELYQATDLVSNTAGAVTDALLLGAIGCGLFALGVLAFTRRDLSV
ncbi:ABC transporter permease subunit [Adlercreutzia sp. ZJ141]|uniref:ABC transporter permease subunit n=1 Tax=Adlercreutzia sp. ZJ141 TaxID=2709406 RepID=UPI0013EC9F04|nr:ABC transporter permease subunit [Adlercreutzia sp. ZJ141]